MIDSEVARGSSGSIRFQLLEEQLLVGVLLHSFGLKTGALLVSVGTFSFGQSCWPTWFPGELGRRERFYLVDEVLFHVLVFYEFEVAAVFIFPKLRALLLLREVGLGSWSPLVS